jgi:diguanylate cyclase (GGDEF)-like protein
MLGYRPKMNEPTKKQHFQHLKAFSLLGIIFIIVSIISYWAINDAVNKTAKNQALFVAETVATQAKAARSVYSSAVASKLKQEGTGPHVNSSDKPGYIPIPAQFLKLIGLETSANADYIYKYKPVSKWQLEPSQGLSDAFLQWAWPLLEAQDQETPSKPIKWEPIYRFEAQDGRQVLRYLHADPAAQASCVSCHNAYEKRANIIAIRKESGINDVKQWQLHQLLGALSITIPLDNLKIVADEQIFETSLLFISILISSFLALSYLSLRMIEKERLITETKNKLALLEQSQKDAALLEYMGTHDALTDVPNRSLLLDRIKQAISSACRREQLAAVLFIDLDQFKLINDSLGHAIGDLLLIEVSKRLRISIREEDTLARQGGDEFIILLPSLKTEEHAAIVGKKLVELLQQPYQVLNHELHISASIGITLFPNDGVDVDTLLKNSDIAMYHAKSSGRNNYKFYNAELNANAKEKHKLVSNLRQDIDGKNFELYYQPIINIKTGAIDRLEVLIRWHSHEYGEVSPQQFIPLAEESGLIIAIGDWVLKTACLQFKEWQEQGYSIRKLAINLSTRQFYQQGFAQQIGKLLKDTGLKASAIELEITEGLLMDNTDQVIEMMNELTSMGIEMSIDDFGTGYSSLSYLKRFPIDTLKIDRSFIIDLHKGKHDLDIVKTIINLAHSMHMKVVAEGVEDIFQLDILEKLNCDFYQGYYFSRPVPANKITSLITKGG